LNIWGQNDTNLLAARADIWRRIRES